MKPGKKSLYFRRPTPCAKFSSPLYARVVLSRSSNGGAVASSDVQRKLTAILCTDVVGYSRLMGDDHEGTLQSLTEYRKVFSDKIEQYSGRVVNDPGDSILAEFASVVDAVSCAVEIQ